MFNFVPNATSQTLTEDTRKAILASVLDAANREFMRILRDPTPEQHTQVHWCMRNCAGSL
jgi:proteasome lid subunit RPN8/RPN11